MRQLARPLVLTWIVGCGDDRVPTTAMHAYASPPSCAWVCQLVPHQSTSADVRRVRGQPDNDQTLPDESATSFDDDDPLVGRNTTLALIRFWFTSDSRFDRASVANIDMPSCWAFDGGV